MIIPPPYKVIKARRHKITVTIEKTETTILNNIITINSVYYSEMLIGRMTMLIHILLSTQLKPFRNSTLRYWLTLHFFLRA
jgi:hypothetical protein